MNIKPTQDFVLIKKLGKDGDDLKKTDSGLFIPNKKEDKFEVLTGLVMETGPGRRLPGGDIAEMQVTKDEKVLYKQYAGHQIKKDDEVYWLINEKDIIAVIE